MNASLNLKTARSLKTRAKNRRDAQRYKSARANVLEAINLLKAGLAEAKIPEDRSEHGAELADSWGLLGGIERRWALDALSDGNEDAYMEHMRESVKAYDAGYDDYESESEFGIVDSYNLVNRLVSRILLVPECLSEAEMEVEGLNVKENLVDARKEVHRQARLARRGDVWALSDLGLLDILVERRPPVTAYSNFVSQSPPDYAYDSTLSVLESLRSLEIPMKDEINEAVAYLEMQLKQLVH